MPATSKNLLYNSAQNVLLMTNLKQKARVLF